jgi:hypothetical protein
MSYMLKLKLVMIACGLISIVGLSVTALLIGK